jgi:hypothetical protein
MGAQLFECFFDLPPELREQVLSHICVFPNGILVGGGVDGRSIPLPVTSPPTSTTAAVSTVTHNVTAACITCTNQPFPGQEDQTREEEEEEEEGGEHADPPVNLFLASPVLYREAGDLYYGRNDFHLDLASSSWGRRQQSRLASDLTSSAAPNVNSGPGPGSLGPGMGALLRLLTHPDTAHARRRIRSAVVYVKRFGALVLDVLAPALADMVLNGGLRRLRVDVREVGRGPMAPGAVTARLGGETRLRTVDYAGNPALRALLVLLTDPDMERAELRVPRRGHAWFWCRFHQDGVSGEKGRACQALSSSSDGLGVGDEDGFLRVDIHRLVEACAGDAAEFKIKKIESG